MFVGLLIGLIWEHFNQQELAAAAGRKGDGRSAYKVHTEEAENLVMEEKSQHRRMTPMKVEAIIDRRDEAQGWVIGAMDFVGVAKSCCRCTGDNL
ncbi:hypothetical protein Goarm_008419 [Gossypium armourianum]|uniref:Uncharacterized protein n=1 Tax=Gossypium armourianum TaxID=34283 RepID=A0A7J9JPV7_9ROSI|nr:hypothetical protein [Gossypium armourianum]